MTRSPSRRYSPAISLAICVGLGLDYDIFFSEAVKEEYDKLRRAAEKSRIEESEQIGIDRAAEKSRIEESVLVARKTTGGIISAAGLIMIVSFAPLLMCNTLLLNEVRRRRRVRAL